MKVNILGKRWEIIKSTKEKHKLLEFSEAYCDFNNKQIIITDMQDLETYRNKVLRHELLHAILYEAGFKILARNEKLVEFLAVNIHDINILFKELEVIE